MAIASVPQWRGVDADLAPYHATPGPRLGRTPTDHTLKTCVAVQGGVHTDGTVRGAAGRGTESVGAAGRRGGVGV